MQALWNAYIAWGLAKPVPNTAVNQLAVSSIISPATQARVNAVFPETGVAAGLGGGALARQLAFAEAIFIALANTTMAFAARETRKAKAYNASGFASLWALYGND